VCFDFPYAGFAAHNGARPDAIKVALLVIDRRSTNPDAVRRELVKVRRLGIKLIVIGVGGDVDTDELTSLASDSDFFIAAETYDGLQAIQIDVVQRICTGIVLKSLTSAL
jgi:hypothetical protein